MLKNLSLQKFSIQPLINLNHFYHCHLFNINILNPLNPILQNWNIKSDSKAISHTKYYFSKFLKALSILKNRDQNHPWKGSVINWSLLGPAAW